MVLTKWMKRAGADGFSSAAKMKSRVSSNFMGAIDLHSTPDERVDDGWFGCNLSLNHDGKRYAATTIKI
jgi:hypothetical protein